MFPDILKIFQEFGALNSKVKDRRVMIYFQLFFKFTWFARWSYILDPYIANDLSGSQLLEDKY